MIAAMQQLSELRHLNLSRNPIGDEGALAIASSKHFARLETIRLDGCGITDDGRRCFGESPHLRRLRYLPGCDSSDDDGW
jgi:hypothetical protein